MQIRPPVSRLSKVLRHSIRQEDVPAISAVHYAPGKIDSSSCDVCSIIHVENFINWPAVNAHPKLQLRIFLQLFADLHRTPHRRFGTIKKNQGHPIANRSEERRVGK